MSSNNSSISNDIKKTLDLYLSHWKIITLCVIIALALAYSYLRYSTYSYSASAIIQIKDDKESSKLKLENELAPGLFQNGANKLQDEIQVLTSRYLISNVIENLNLNVSYYTQGKIIEKEHYKNPPIKVNFFSSDSVIKQVDTTLFIKIKSQTEFLMFKDDGKSILDRDDKNGKSSSFGDRIKTGFGDIVIIPNIGDYKPMIGSNLRISIKPTKALISKYKSKIVVGTAEGSSVLRLEIEEHIPEKAIDILNEIIKEYNKDVLKDKEEVIKVTSEFINNRLELVFKELEEVDFTAEQIQKRNNLTALGSQANIYLESEKINEAKINNTTNTIQLIDYLSDELKQKNSSSDLVPTNVIGLNDPNIDQITRSHNELVAERNRLLKNSSEKNPIVINLTDEINALKANLDNALTNMKRTSEITLNSLNIEDRRIRGQLYTAPTKQRQLRDIEREQGIKESLYLYLLEKREESAIRLGMYSPKAKIIDTAYSSYMPVAPRVMFTYLAAFLLGLAIPIVFIYLKDLLDTKLYGKDDVVDLLDIPYLGDIPKSPKKEKLVKKVDYTPKAEAFRIVRSNIDFLLSDIKGRSKKLFITSTKAQEGKSHTSTNLATSISFSEKSVLLIEMDIRVPKILEYLNIKEKPKKGLSDYLADSSVKPQDVVFKNKETPYLDIIPSGTIPPNPSELLMSDRVEELFKHFENKYDYIIADTSAVGLVSDTMLISKHADMFVYVVSAEGVDKRQLVHVAKPLYDEKRLPNMMLLLNGTVAGKKGYGYGYGYGNNPNRKKKWYQFS